MSLPAKIVCLAFSPGQLVKLGEAWLWRCAPPGSPGNTNYAAAVYEASWARDEYLVSVKDVGMFLKYTTWYDRHLAVVLFGETKVLMEPDVLELVSK